LLKIFKNFLKISRLRYQCCVKIKNCRYIFKNMNLTKKLG